MSALTVPPAGRTYSITPSGDDARPWALTIGDSPAGLFSTCNDAISRAAEALWETPKYAQYLIAAIDTETTGVLDDDEVWEIGVVLRDPQLGRAADRRVHMFVEHDLAKVSRLPESYQLDHNSRYDAAIALSQEEAGAALRDLLVNAADGRPLYLLGAVPSFDERQLKPLLQSVPDIDGGEAWKPWHYRLQCIESIARGWLYGRGVVAPMTIGSDDLVAMTGFVVADQDGNPLYVRHTALDDAQWALDWHDHLYPRGPRNGRVEESLTGAMLDLISKGVPHAWGGGTIDGPSRGVSDGCLADQHADRDKVGFDAGSLARYLIATAFGIELPRTTSEQLASGTVVPEVSAGDLVFFHGDPNYAMVYLGRGCVAHANASGMLLSIGSLPPSGVYYVRVSGLASPA